MTLFKLINFHSHTKDNIWHVGIFPLIWNRHRRECRFWSNPLILHEMTVLSRKQPFNLIFLCNLSLKLNHLCNLVYLIDKKKKPKRVLKNIWGWHYKKKKYRKKSSWIEKKTKRGTSLFINNKTPLTFLNF